MVMMTSRIRITNGIGANGRRIFYIFIFIFIFILILYDFRSVGQYQIVKFMFKV